MSAPIPPGWSAHQAPDGRLYFANSTTGATQWHHPSSPPPQYQPNPYPSQQQQLQQPPYAAAPSNAYPPSSSLQMVRAPGAPILQQPAEFKLQEKAFSLSGDAFTIKRVDTGEAFFKVKGNALSLKDSKTLFDAHGNALYKMSESVLSLRGRMQIVDATSKQPVVTLRKKGFIPGFGSSTIQAWAGASDEGQPWIEVKGDFFRKDFTVTEVNSGRALATVRRKSMTLTNILLEKDTYIIRVEPGNDTALLVFFVVAVDEQYRDDGNRKGFSSFL